MKKLLPPGQYEALEFPRFGLARFAGRFPKQVHRIELEILGDVEEAVTLSAELETLALGASVGLSLCDDLELPFTSMEWLSLL
jgi:hypothetical protein